MRGKGRGNTVAFQPAALIASFQAHKQHVTGQPTVCSPAPSPCPCRFEVRFRSADDQSHGSVAPSARMHLHMHIFICFIIILQASPAPLRLVLPYSCLTMEQDFLITAQSNAGASEHCVNSASLTLRKLLKSGDLASAKTIFHQPKTRPSQDGYRFCNINNIYQIPVGKWLGKSRSDIIWRKEQLSPLAAAHNAHSHSFLCAFPRWSMVARTKGHSGPGLFSVPVGVGVSPKRH